jgi:hypothetical protein
LRKRAREGGQHVGASVAGRDDDGGDGHLLIAKSGLGVKQIVRAALRVTARPLSHAEPVW